MGTRVYALVALASMLMTQSQDGRRHSGDQAHHPETPEPRTLSVQVTRNRSVNHPSVDSKDLPLDAINVPRIIRRTPFVIPEDPSWFIKTSPNSSKELR